MTSSDLVGRRVIVTGASSGIGNAVAGRFREAGADVVGLDLRPTGQDLQCDVADEASVEAAFGQVGEAGEITDVVHSAGIAALGPFRDFTLADWDRIISVNLTGSFLVGRAAARRLPRG